MEPEAVDHGLFRLGVGIGRIQAAMVPRPAPGLRQTVRDIPVGQPFTCRYGRCIRVEPLLGIELRVTLADDVPVVHLRTGHLRPIEGSAAAELIADEPGR